MKSSARVALTGVCFGIIAGVAVSILPIPINFVAGAVIIAVWTIARVCRRAQFTARAVGVAVAVAIIAAFVAIVLPVKQLDGIVPPVHYEHMSLVEVCDSLARDHRVFVSPDEPARAKAVATFTTERPMTRREVLQKLARDTGTHLDIRYCGIGASLLFGAHPSFTRLRSAERPPQV